MRDFIILITVISALIAGTAYVDSTNSNTLKEGDEDIEKPHIKIP